MLTPQEAEALFETIRAMAADGRTVIFISHKLNEVKAVADRVTVLRGGQVGRDRADRRGDAALARRADGGARARSRPPTRARGEPAGEAVLELDEVWADGDRGDDRAQGRAR